jgi:predicted small lipoprotein YifL
MKRFSLLLLLLFLFLSLSFCGKKGPLLPPLAKIPNNVEVFDAIQRGERVILEWGNPQTYIDGSLLAVDIIEVWLYEAEKESPRKEEFEVKAGLVASIGKKELTEHQINKGVASSKLRYEHKLSQKDFGSKNLIFGLRVEDRRKRESEFSELRSLKPIILSIPPQQIQANVFEDRIEIRWRAPEKNIDQSSPAYLKGYNVYRAEGEGLAQRLNPELVKEEKYQDRNFVFERLYRYFVRASATELSPFVESEDSEKVEVVPKDIFPPAPPSGLVSVSVGNLISLSWDANREKDLAGYRVWRKAEGEAEFILLTPELIQENAYSDTKVEKNKRYYYAITAQDKSGNESVKSDVVSEIAKDEF